MVGLLLIGGRKRAVCPEEEKEGLISIRTGRVKMI
jgi:hypothetical protein